METNPRTVPEGGCKSIVKRADALGCRNDINVVEEGEDGLTVYKLALQVGERSVLRQGIKCRHQRVALLAALSLTNFVRAAIIVEPGVDARHAQHRTAVRRAATVAAPAENAGRLGWIRARRGQRHQRHRRKGQ